MLVDLKVPNLETSPPDILADVTDAVMARQYGYRGLIMASFVTVTTWKTTGDWLNNSLLTHTVDY